MARRVVEPLETRRLLNAAVEIWAGNQDYTGGADPQSDFLNIDKPAYGYEKIAESSQAGDVLTYISGALSYSYIVIATRAQVQVDCVEGYLSAMGSTYFPLSNVLSSANTTGASSALNATDGSCMTVGTATSPADFAGYIVVANSDSDNHLRFTFGTVTPMIDFGVRFTANYLQGATRPFIYDADVDVSDNGFVTGVKVHSPSGWLLDMQQRQVNGESRWEYDASSADGVVFSSMTEVLSRTGYGLYSVELYLPTGSPVTYFAVGGGAFPTQIPATSSYTHGQTDANPAAFVALPHVTDSNVDYVSLAVEDQNEQSYFSQSGILPTATSVGPVGLPTNTSFSANLDYVHAIAQPLNADGYQSNVIYTNSLNMVFGTANSASGLPDLTFPTLSATPATVNPGDSFDLTIGVQNAATGLAIGHGTSGFAPIGNEVHLSQNHTWGDADDVVILSTLAAGELSPWSLSRAMTLRLPADTPAGAYYLVGKMDVGGTVAESVETNNKFWSATPVITVPPQAIVLDRNTHLLMINGTKAADNAAISFDGQTIQAYMNQTARVIPLASVNAIGILGSDGNDTIMVNGSLAAAQVYNSSLAGVYIDGGLGNDVITGSDAADSLYGNDGDDTVFAGGGNDIVYGGNGNDALRGDDGNDSVWGELGDDRLYGDKGFDLLYGGDGADRVDGGTGNDTLYGGKNQDYMTGAAGADLMYGEDGKDTLLGGDQNDTLDGGAGWDSLDGGTGNDVIFAIDAVTYTDTVVGGGGTDTAHVNQLLDSVSGVLNVLYT